MSEIAMLRQLVQGAGWRVQNNRAGLNIRSRDGEQD
jgi:hypothetical protein